MPNFTPRSYQRCIDWNTCTPIALSLAQNASSRAGRSRRSRGSPDVWSCELIGVRSRFLRLFESSLCFQSSVPRRGFAGSSKARRQPPISSTTILRLGGSQIRCEREPKSVVRLPLMSFGRERVRNYQAEIGACLASDESGTMQPFPSCRR
jgi:hypothetical protein